MQAVERPKCRRKGPLRPSCAHERLARRKAAGMDGADVLDSITAEWLRPAVLHDGVQLLSANVRRCSIRLGRSFTLCGAQRPHRILPGPTRRET
jgi:hypothetical protein